MELKESLRSLGKWVDWKKQYEQLNQHHTELLESISEKEQKIANLEDNLKQSGYNTLLKIILGMAMDKYNYKPTGRNTATGGNKNSISAGLELVGLPVSDDTIREYLKKAKKLLL